VEEQIPWDGLTRLISEMGLDFTAYYEGEDFIGFTIVYPRPSFSWFWYFAVREDLRGQGYGQQILPLVVGKYRGQSLVMATSSISNMGLLLVGSLFYVLFLPIIYTVCKPLKTLYIEEKL